MVFSNTSTQKLYIHICIYIYIYLPKTKKFGCVGGRPDFSFLFKSCEILEVRGDLSINVENKKSSRVDRQVGRK